MADFKHSPKTFPKSSSFEFRKNQGISAWCLQCQKPAKIISYRSGRYEIETIDGPQADHHGFDLYTLSCHRSVEKFVVYVFGDPMTWVRVG
ncbi:MAG: hypothetical protein ACAH59_05155 [Pseudobdellovibrionaceae bacterium]